MGNLLNNQSGLFVMYIAGGIIICILFDIFRALRKSIKTSDTITYVEDAIFWIITAVFLIYLIFVLNSGNLRIYNFIGLFLGVVIYYLTVSKYFMKILVKILTFFKKVITKILVILLIPARVIFKINKKLICIACINLQNMTNIFKKFLKTTKKEKKIAK